MKNQRSLYMCMMGIYRFSQKNQKEYVKNDENI